MIPLFAADVSQLPTTWIGLIAFIAAIAVAPTVAIWQSTRTRKKVADVQSSVNDTNEQVFNNHRTNLRADLSESLNNTNALREQVTESVRLMGIIKTGIARLQDEDIRLIRSDIGRLSGDVQTLRGELTEERDARTSLEHRFNERENRERPN